MANFRPIDRATPFLLPPSVDDWLGKDHLARFVVDIVDQLDLSPLTEQYRGAGSAAYHPAVMLRRNSDPDVPIDTNHIERRSPFATSRPTSSPTMIRCALSASAFCPS